MHMGDTAVFSLGYGAQSAPPCKAVTVHFKVGTKATPNVDFTLTDANGQDATALGTVTNGPLTLHIPFTSRKKHFSVTVTLLKDKAYYLGKSIKATVYIKTK